MEFSCCCVCPRCSVRHRRVMGLRHASSCGATRHSPFPTRLVMECHCIFISICYGILQLTEMAFMSLKCIESVSDHKGAKEYVLPPPTTTLCISFSVRNKFLYVIHTGIHQQLTTSQPLEE